VRGCIVNGRSQKEIVVYASLKREFNRKFTHVILHTLNVLLLELQLYYLAYISQLNVWYVCVLSQRGRVDLWWGSFYFACFIVCVSHRERRVV
jgi:hypothetical protein